MEYKINYTHSVSKIPPRCRKPRFVEEEGEFMITVKEVNRKDLKPAFIVGEYDGETVIRRYAGNDKLYKLAKKKTDDGEEVLTISSFDPVKALSHRFYGTKTHDEIVAEAEEYADSYLIVGCDIYVAVSEPRYCIYTFGLGHNHGSTALLIDYRFNENISRERYFNALDYKKALKTALEIAKKRGDTESLSRIANGPFIDVIQKQAVKCNPATHGEGNPILNDFERVIENSKSKEDAGLLIMVNTMIKD